MVCPLISRSCQWSPGPFPGVAQEFPPASARSSCVTPCSLGEVLAPNPTVKKPVPKIDLRLHRSRKAGSAGKAVSAMGAEASRAARSQS